MPHDGRQLTRSIGWATAALLYVTAGGVLLAFGLPLAALLFDWEGLDAWLARLPLTLPVWLGALSMPGCGVALMRVRDGGAQRPAWVSVSLWGALVASAAGLAGGTMMALFLLPGLVALVGTAALRYAFDGVRSRSRRDTVGWWVTVLGVMVAALTATAWALQPPREAQPDHGVPLTKAQRRR